MKTPPKIVRFSASTSTRQSPRHRGYKLVIEPRIEASINWVPTYINLRLLGALEVQLSKSAKYPTPMPPMSEDIPEEGDLLDFIPQFRYQDYNL